MNQNESARQRDAERFPTLEAWLAAESRGELEDPGVEEPTARHLVNPGALHRYVTQRARIQKSRPRSCVGCGAAFQPQSTTARRCLSCVERRRPSKVESPTPPASKRRHAPGRR
jgi:hypothetical protein